MKFFNKRGFFRKKPIMGLQDKVTEEVSKSIPQQVSLDLSSTINSSTDNYNEKTVPGEFYTPEDPEIAEIAKELMLLSKTDIARYGMSTKQDIFSHKSDEHPYIPEAGIFTPEDEAHEYLALKLAGSY